MLCQRQLFITLSMEMEVELVIFCNIRHKQADHMTILSFNIGLMYTTFLKPSSFSNAINVHMYNTMEYISYFHIYYYNLKNNEQIKKIELKWHIKILKRSR